MQYMYNVATGTPSIGACLFLAPGAPGSKWRIIAMASHQSKPQKETVGRVMHEFKHGELRSGTGKKVKNARQAVASALSEAGASNQQSPEENKEHLRRTRGRGRAEVWTPGRRERSIPGRALPPGA
jgi:hypothetical protein